MRRQPRIVLRSVKRAEKPVEATERLWAYPWIRFDAVVAEDANYDVTGKLLLRGSQGPYVLDSVCFKARDEPITGTGVRSVPLEAVTNLVLAKHGVTTLSHERVLLDSVPEIIKGKPIGAQIRAAGIHDEAALDVVTDAYVHAVLTGSPAAEAVALKLECSLPTAAKFIRSARRYGILRIERD
jgi:hypothetical protein